MARIVGVDIPNDKRVVVSLTYIYGIGTTTAKKVLKTCGISEDIRVKNLTEEQLTAIRNEISKIKVEGDLRREVEKVYQLMDKEPRLTQELEKDRRKLSPTRRKLRRNERSIKLWQIRKLQLQEKRKLKELILKVLRTFILPSITPSLLSPTRVVM